MKIYVYLLTANRKLKIKSNHLMHSETQLILNDFRSSLSLRAIRDCIKASERDLAQEEPRTMIDTTHTTRGRTLKTRRLVPSAPTELRAVIFSLSLFLFAPLFPCLFLFLIHADHHSELPVNQWLVSTSLRAASARFSPDSS